MLSRNRTDSSRFDLVLALQGHISDLETIVHFYSCMRYASLPVGISASDKKDIANMSKRVCVGPGAIKFGPLLYQATIFLPFHDDRLGLFDYGHRRHA